MAEYKETTIAGNKWTRCVKMTIDNPLQQLPSITMAEEDVIVMGDNMKFKVPSLNIHVPYDPTAVIELYDPATMQKTGGTITHQEVYGLLFSIYIDSALKRDARIAEMIPVDIPPDTPPV